MKIRSPLKYLFFLFFFSQAFIINILLFFLNSLLFVCLLKSVYDDELAWLSLFSLFLLGTVMFTESVPKQEVKSSSTQQVSRTLSILPSVSAPIRPASSVPAQIIQKHQVAQFLSLKFSRRIGRFFFLFYCFLLCTVSPLYLSWANLYLKAWILKMAYECAFFFFFLFYHAYIN